MKGFVVSSVVLTAFLYAFSLHSQDSGASVREQSAVIPHDGWSHVYFQPAITHVEDRIGAPTRLIIDSMNVSAEIEHVRLTPNGAMETPTRRDRVAWLELGPRPGEIGSAVIAGHYGRRNAKASVFDTLHTLRSGDRLTLETDRGESIEFAVRESRRYGSDALAADVFSSSDGGAHLHLITCEGEWDEDTLQYPTRLVVFADRVH